MASVISKTEISKSRNHKILSNYSNPQHPFRLQWEVNRRGAAVGFAVKMHRDTDREGAEEFANRWNVKMPAGTK